MTGREIWRDMTRFWGKLFGINFAMGVATGITMEFQFGTNWAYYSPLCGGHFRRAAGDRRPDGLLPGIDFRRPVLLRLGPADRSRPSFGHLAGGHGLQPLGAMDFDRERLDAEPGRRRVQSRHHAHGADLVLGLVFNPVAQAKFVHTVGPAMSPARCLSWRSRPIICSPAGFAGVRQALDHVASASGWRRRCAWSCSATRADTRSRKIRK